MFWKLCKHELKCSYRSFLVLYAIVMVAALLMNPRNEGMITNIAAIVYIIMSVVMFIMCVVVIIKNYSNSMFSRNSYLTHTLPVTSTQLLLTKILSAVFWIIVSVFVLFLSMLIIGLRVSGFDFFSYYRDAAAILQHRDCSGFPAVSVLYDCRYGRIRGLGLSGYEYNAYHLCTAISHGSCHSALYSDILDTQLCV